MLTYRLQLNDGLSLPVTGIPIAGSPLAVRRAARGDWTVDHVPTGISAKPGRVLLKNRRAALAFGRGLAGTPLPWDAGSRDEFQARLSRLSREAWDCFRDLCDPYDRLRARRPVRVFVRAFRYRDRDGFLVAGRDTEGREVDVFVEDRAGADRIRSAVKAGGDYGKTIGDVLLARA